ncbi:MAG TPA: adenylate cyclase regulatory domain-containing protein [Microthrixaceae bacterium]|nr:adenylate cyclase regulatory domain-containing protein [Microthrixaceae bacterium]
MDLHRSVGLEPSTLRRADIAAATGADPERTIRWWRAMGFPEVADDTVAFNELDLDLVMRVAELEDAGLVDDDDIARLARLLGASFQRIAEASSLWWTRCWRRRLTPIRSCCTASGSASCSTRTIRRS